MYFDWCFEGMAENSVGQVVDMWLKVTVPFFLSLLHDLLLVLYIVWSQSVIKVHLLPTYYCKASLPFCFICTLVCVLFTVRLFCRCMYWFVLHKICCLFVVFVFCFFVFCCFLSSFTEANLPCYCSPPLSLLFTLLHCFRLRYIWSRSLALS